MNLQRLSEKEVNLIIEKKQVPENHYCNIGKIESK